MFISQWLRLVVPRGEVLLAVEIGEVVPLVLFPSCLAPLSLQGPAHRPFERFLLK